MLSIPLCAFPLCEKSWKREANEVEELLALKRSLTSRAEHVFSSVSSQPGKMEKKPAPVHLPDPDIEIPSPTPEDDRVTRSFTLNPFKRGARNTLEKSIQYSVDKNCKCGKFCLRQLKREGPFNYQHAAEILEDVRFKVHQNGHNTLAQQKDALRPSFDRTIVKTDKKGDYSYDCKLNNGPYGEISVCRSAWARAHNVTLTMLETLAKEKKAGTQSSSRAFSDKSHTFKSIEEVKRALRNSGLEETKERVRAAILNSGDASTECYKWFEEFFHFSGDHIPNSNEIHIEHSTYLALYNQYKKECVTTLGLSQWKEIWDNLFPHVKMREYKQVTGKCETCAMLTGLRTKFTHPTLKQMVTDLHELHRITYMNERMSYYNRRKEAVDYPDEVFSCITDGMSQNHTKLPHESGQYTSHAQLDIKIQGVIDHGRKKLHLFLCMISVAGNANLNMHSFLLALDAWRNEKGHFPRKIYWQIDGGSENANKNVLALCEYLVAKTPIEEIVLTRLPVGHTHEDIDGRFGKIWEHCRLQTILTPEDYKTKLKSTFPENKDLEPEYIFAVPDYELFFSDFIDKNLVGYTKKYDTKLQWKFTKTTEAGFPLSVKSIYRAFCEDNVLLIVDKKFIPEDKLAYSAQNVGIQAVEAIVDWQPRNRITNQLVGQFQLQKLPTKSIRPQGLVLGSREKLDVVVRNIRKRFGAESPVTRSWEEYSTKFAPLDDNVLTYLRDHKDKVKSPRFFDQLFRSLEDVTEVLNIRPVESHKRVREETIVKCISLPSVQTSQNPRQPAFVWADTGAAVFEENAVDPTGDLLHARDFEKMTNNSLKDLIDRLNEQYPSKKIKRTGNKATLASSIKKAVEELREQRDLLASKTNIDDDDDVIDDVDA